MIIILQICCFGVQPSHLWLSTSAAGATEQKDMKWEANILPQSVVTASKQSKPIVNQQFAKVVAPDRQLN
jgi:hypothetical protein